MELPAGFAHDQLEQATGDVGLETLGVALVDAHHLGDHSTIARAGTAVSLIAMSNRTHCQVVDALTKNECEAFLP